MSSLLNPIRVALENHLATIGGDPLPAIAWPNVPFTRAVGAPYIHVEFLPMGRRPVTVGPAPEQRRFGLFFLTVYTPESQGAAAGMLLAERLERRFDGSTAIVAPTVNVRLEYSEAKPPLQDPPFFAIPVEIGWYAYTR
jgi:hypothetical protein